MLQRDGSSDSAYDREDDIGRREFRLDHLGACLHDDCTESLRTRWCEELALVHGEYLDDDEAERAAELQHQLERELQRPVELQRQLERELQRPAAPAPRDLVWRQHVARARVGLDAVLHRVARGQDDDARRRLPALLSRAQPVASAPDGAELLAGALAAAHGVERRTGHAPGARAYLRQLRELAAAWATPPMRETLARALCEAVQAEVGPEVGAALDPQARERLRDLLQALRTAAARPRATEPERTMLAQALLAVHQHAGHADRTVLEHELGALAQRPGAAHEQRKAWVQALDRAASRQGRRCMRPPLELLRARAYRSADTEDLGALFERLEADLPLHTRSFTDLVGALNEMRAIAERPEADPALRLRFARHWLERSFDARRYDYGAITNDRCAHAWARHAAQRGDLEGRVLLGRCLAAGRGVDRDRTAAAEHFRHATAEGSDEAQMLLRLLGVERVPWLRHRYSALMLFGVVMLVLHLLTQPFRFDPWGVVAYLALLGGSMFGVGLGAWILDRLRGRHSDPDLGSDPDSDSDSDNDTEGSSYVFDQHVSQFERRPWQILVVVTEDGFSLAPLAWLGIGPFTAAAMSLLFGLSHYPQYSLRTCLHLAATYTAVALLILPWAGLWPIAVGHVLYDVLLLVWGSRSRRTG